MDNSSEAVLKELRAIRTLLSIDNQDVLEERMSGLSEIQLLILDMLDETEWRRLPTSEIAEKADSGSTTVREHRAELEELNMIKKRGERKGSEYRKTGLVYCSEALGIVE